jgi:hypothetical protein
MAFDESNRDTRCWGCEAAMNNRHNLYLDQQVSDALNASRLDPEATRADRQ